MILLRQIRMIRRLQESIHSCNFFALLQLIFPKALKLQVFRPPPPGRRRSLQKYPLSCNILLQQKKTAYQISGKRPKNMRSDDWTKRLGNAQPPKDQPHHSHKQPKHAKNIRSDYFNTAEDAGDINNLRAVRVVTNRHHFAIAP